MAKAIVDECTGEGEPGKHNRKCNAVVTRRMRVRIPPSAPVLMRYPGHLMFRRDWRDWKIAVILLMAPAAAAMVAGWALLRWVL